MADQTSEEEVDIVPASVESVASADESAVNQPSVIEAEIVEEETEADAALVPEPEPPPDFTTTPRQDGFRMPAEFEPHARCWMLWPERPDVWRDNARHAQKAFARVAQAISKFEPVTVGAPRHLIEEARSMLGSRVSVVPIAYNDAWVRDNGPTFVTNSTGEVRAVDWQFNAWGGLYDNFEQDKKTAHEITKILNTKRYKADFVLEGGAIHTDGEDTLLTTEECLLNPNRNPHLTKSQIEDRLKAYLNVEKVIWLRRGVFLDETSGHVDNLVCFARPGEVLLTWTDDQSDPQYDISREAYEVLATSTDAKGRSFKIYKLHQPNIMYYTEEESAGIEELDTSYERLEGQRIAASYVNFYIANGGIVMPMFQDAEYDNRAAETIQEAFPDRRIRVVYAREILLGGGNIHCITQQQPMKKVRK